MQNDNNPRSDSSKPKGSQTSSPQPGGLIKRVVGFVRGNLAALTDTIEPGAKQIAALNKDLDEVKAGWKGLPKDKEGSRVEAAYIAGRTEIVSAQIRARTGLRVAFLGASVALIFKLFLDKKDQTLAAKDLALKEKDNALQEKDEFLSQKDKALTDELESMRQNRALILDLSETVKAKNFTIGLAEAVLKQGPGLYAEYQRKIAEHEKDTMDRVETSANTADVKIADTKSNGSTL